ncbi:MAG: hypothetical protein WC249_03580 [Patescibacteria group bacterium]
MKKINLTPSKTAEKMAVQYLQHEFRKILSGIKNSIIWNSIDRELSRFIKVQGEASFWNLVAAIAEDWKLKAVYRLLTDTKFEWTKQQVPIKKIILTGMSPAIDSFIISKFERNPLRFQAAWEKDKEMRRIFQQTGFARHKERDDFPIFLFQASEGYRVFDGMRRSLLTIIDHKKTINAWVGKPVNEKGQPLISDGAAYVLSQVYNHATKKSKSLDNSMLQIGAVISDDYRNGQKLLQERIAGWSHDKKLKQLFLNMAKTSRQNSKYKKCHGK